MTQRVVASMLLLVGAWGCGAQAVRPVAHTVPATLAIEQVGVDPKVIDAARGQTARIGYMLTAPADMTGRLVDASGVMVREVRAGRQAAGAQSLWWDGTDHGGRRVEPGVYRYMLDARAPDAMAHYPLDHTGGDELQPRDFSYEASEGKLRWIMPRAGWARLRVGLEGLPHLRTLLDWEPLPAGEHVVTWDGKDESGRMMMQRHPNLSIKLVAFAMPDNTVIVQGPAGGRDGLGKPEYPPLDQPNAGYLHARHARGTCREAAFRVELPEAVRQEQGWTVVRGVTPVRVVLDPRDEDRMVDQRFEIAVFEDTTILFEEEEGSNPFTYLWDTTRLPTGRHLLTVNVLGYADHFGTMTQPVVIERMP